MTRVACRVMAEGVCVCAQTYSPSKGGIKSFSTRARDINLGGRRRGAGRSKTRGASALNGVDFCFCRRMTDELHVMSATPPTRLLKVQFVVRTTPDEYHIQRLPTALYHAPQRMRAVLIPSTELPLTTTTLCPRTPITARRSHSLPHHVHQALTYGSDTVPCGSFLSASVCSDSPLPYSTTKPGLSCVGACTIPLNHAPPLHS